MTEQYFGDHKITNCRIVGAKAYADYQKALAEEIAGWEYDQAFAAARQRTIMALARVDVDLGEDE